MEIWPIERHLFECIRKYETKSYCVFIAPSIFFDGKEQIDYIKEKKHLCICPYKITDFVSYFESNSTLYSYHD